MHPQTLLDMANSQHSKFEHEAREARLAREARRGRATDRQSSVALLNWQPPMAIIGALLLLAIAYAALA